MRLTPFLRLASKARVSRRSDSARRSPGAVVSAPQRDPGCRGHPVIVQATSQRLDENRESAGRPADVLEHGSRGPLQPQSNNPFDVRYTKSSRGGVTRSGLYASMRRPLASAETK